MANGINKALLIGNVGSIDIKSNVARISLATSEKFKDKEGNQKEETSWHRLVIFGKLVEIASQYVKKGDKLYIEGTLKYGKYTDSAGVEKYTTDIIVRSMQMLTSKAESQPQARQGAVAHQPPPHPAVDQNNYNRDPFDDDIPF